MKINFNFGDYMTDGEGNKLNIDAVISTVQNAYPDAEITYTDNIGGAIQLVEVEADLELMDDELEGLRQEILDCFDLDDMKFWT